MKSANFNSTYVGTHNLCPRIFHIIHMMQICSNPLPVPAHLSCHTYERVVVVQHSHVPASARAEWRVPISDQNTHGPTMHARVSFMSHIRKRRYHTGMVLMHAELRMLITNPHTEGTHYKSKFMETHGICRHLVQITHVSHSHTPALVRSTRKSESIYLRSHDPCVPLPPFSNAFFCTWIPNTEIESSSNTMLSFVPDLLAQKKKKVTFDIT